ncbi:MAG: type II toxin-antitoxin system PemK/MazF family toxin [Verrucomicrobiota bacterium]
MTNTFKVGDIFICAFPFTSGQFSKPRPVLALIDLGPDCLIARITSVLYSGRLDVPLTHWKQAGLEKPSVVRLTRLVTAEKTLLRTKIGSLTSADLEAVRNAWNQHMRL